MASDTVYLIQYGRPGYVGRFPSALALTRGDRVVLSGPRGLEFGDVLISANERAGSRSRIDPGEVLRLASDADLAHADQLSARGQSVLGLAISRGNELGLPLAFVDIEVTLDGTAILHSLPWSECEATPLLDELAEESGLTLRLLDLSRGALEKEEAAKGCGKPGCGTESGGCTSCGTGGGCSTGSCSRGSVKSAEELTAYFANLRQKMEDAGMVRTPLN